MKLTGYKTYIALALGAITLIAVNVFGVSIPGMSPNPDWVQTLLALAAGGGLRAAIPAK